MSASDPDKESTTPTQEAFLTRWSRRKQATHDAPLTTETQADETKRKAEHDLKQLCDADMPPLESLTEDSDYSGFLSPKVSEALRRQALRKLFHSTGFNIRDGLDDYDEDFTRFEKLGDIVTSDMRHQMEMEAQRRRERAEADADVEAQTQQSQQEQQQEQNQTSEHDDTQLAADEAETPTIQVVEKGEVES